ncbi:hypothetical protein [Aeromonas bestiarum]|uniref:hypothetical protein n=1 Tax=Aeromonas bestiarum TaxID=105751 RepID=UPI003D1F5B1C
MGYPMSRRARLSCALMAVGITTFCSQLAVAAQAASTQAPQLRLTSSSTELTEGFNWAVGKTGQFIMTGKRGVTNKDEYHPSGDGSGLHDYLPSYWAGYYDRSAFYGRDFAHQVTGAEIAGWGAENFSMFKVFARNATEARKWYTLWAFNFDGSPHTIDYKHDDYFVREVPAQFELVEKAYRAYLWSGDRRYLDDPELWRFYRKVLTDFVALHDDQHPNGIAEGRGGIFQGSCTYNERGEHPIEAADAIGAQYQATLAFAAMLQARGESREAREWQTKARQLRRYFNQEWSRVEGDEEGNYARILDDNLSKKSDFGKENSWFIPMKLLSEPGPRNDRYLDFIGKMVGNGIGSTPESPANIEAYTYLPETYFPYLRNEEAWHWMRYILTMRDLPHERPSQGTNGDYPEISFSLVAQTVEELMGVEPDAAAHRVATLPRLPAAIDWVAIEQLTLGSHRLSLRHDGKIASTLGNEGRHPLTWEARFPGRHVTLLVDGKRRKARQLILNGIRLSVIEVAVLPGQQVNVMVPAPRSDR